MYVAVFVCIYVTAFAKMGLVCTIINIEKFILNTAYFLHQSKIIQWVFFLMTCYIHLAELPTILDGFYIPVPYIWG